MPPSAEETARRRSLLTYAACVGLVLLGSLRLLGPGGLESVWPTALFALAVYGAGLLGLLGPSPVPLGRRFPKAFANLFPGALNVLLAIAILASVSALLVLMGFINAPSPRATIGAWLLVPLLSLALVGTIFVQRFGFPRPSHGKGTIIVTSLVGATALVFLANSLLLESTRFLFVFPFAIEPSRRAYVVLTGLALLSVCAMSLFRIPTLMELIWRRDETGRPMSMTSASPLVFAVTFTGVVTALLLAIVLFGGRLSSLGGALPGSITARVLLLFPLAVLLFVGTAIATTLFARRTRRLRVKLTHERKVYLGVLIATAAATLILLAVALRLSFGHSIHLGLRTIGPRYATEAIVATLLAATGPIGFYVHRENRRLDALEERLSDFLTDLAESSKAGMSLSGALESAAHKDYGPLSIPVKQMAHQVSWGVSFLDAFRRFGESSPSRVIRRAANLVVECARSGGNTNDVLRAAAKDVYDIKSLESDRRVTMTTYLIVVYVVFFVFLGVLAILAVVFLPQLGNIGKVTSTASAGLFRADLVDVAAVKNAYLSAVLVQALGNGIVAGVVRENRYSAGLRHAFIMVFIAYVAFRAFIL